MKKLLTIISIITFFISTSNSSADEIKIERTYLGLISWAQVNEKAPAELPVSGMTGIFVTTTSGFKAIALGKYTSYDRKAMGALWWEHGIFSIGKMPRIPRMLNTPHPVSGDTHFLLPYKDIIKGPTFGTKLKWSNAMVGLYDSGVSSDSLELNAGIWHQLGNTKVNISGYIAEYSQCLVMGAEKENFGFTIHQTMNKNSPNIFSVGSYYTHEKYSYYFSYVKEENAPSQFEFGYWWDAKGKHVNASLNPALGIQNDKAYFAFYLHFWLK